MEVLIPHRVDYMVEGPVPIEDVIGTLYANQRLVTSYGELLGLIFDGLTVERADLRVRQISSSSLKEAFFVALLIVFQKELTTEVPPMVENLLGVKVDDSYDTLLTVGIMVLAFYGADYAYKRYTDQVGSEVIAAKLNDFTEQLAHLSGKPHGEVKRIVENYLSSKGRMKELAKAAIRFFRPSRNKNNEDIIVGNQTIDSETIKLVPNQVDLTALDAEDVTLPMYGAKVEIRAKDHDNDGSGWGGIIAEVSYKRRPIRLYPHISKEHLWTNDIVWADVLVTYRSSGNGDQEPVRYHITRVLEGPPETLADHPA